MPFGNICFPFHTSPVNVKISFPLCVFGGGTSEEMQKLLIRQTLHIANDWK